MSLLWLGYNCLSVWFCRGDKFCLGVIRCYGGQGEWDDTAVPLGVGLANVHRLGRVRRSGIVANLVLEGQVARGRVAAVSVATAHFACIRHALKRPVCVLVGVIVAVVDWRDCARPNRRNVDKVVASDPGVIVPVLAGRASRHPHVGAEKEKGAGRLAQQLRDRWLPSVAIAADHDGIG